MLPGQEGWELSELRIRRGEGLARALEDYLSDWSERTGIAVEVWALPDSTGLDMVTMPAEYRAKVPTANFFQQIGYERNPVARRTGVVGNLIADIYNQMQRGAQAAGARELAAAAN